MDNPHPNPTHDWFHSLDEDDVAEALEHAKSLMELDENESVLVKSYTDDGRKPLTNEDRDHLAESRLVDVLSLIIDGSIVVGTARFGTPPPVVDIHDVAWLIVQQEKDEEQYYEEQRLFNNAPPD